MSISWITADPAPAGAPEPTAHQARRPPARRDGSPPVAPATTPTRPGRATAGEQSLVPTTPVDQWVPLGPSVILRGQADRRPRVAGRVRAIAVSNDGQRIYAGSAQGGLWFSDDGGERWLALDFYASTKTLTGQLGEANALAVGSVAVRFGAALDGADDDVFVGTGEQRKDPFGQLPQAMQGVGIRVAHGPAATVRRDGPTADPWALEATDLAGSAVLRLATEPDRPGVVWAVTFNGLYRRPPAGAAKWTKVDTGLGDSGITDVLVTRGQGGEPRRIYVASWAPAIAWSVTGDPGSWTVVDLPETPLDHRADQVVTRVALAEGNTTGKVVVYALANNPRLWRIEDGTPEAVIGLPERLFGKQADYDMAIAVHPPSGDPALQDRVVVGGSAVRRTESDQYNAALFAAPVRKTGGVWRFELGGHLNEDEGLPPSWIGAGVHADVHDLSWISGPGGVPQLWVACDGGVFRSQPGGVPGKFTNGFVARNSGLATIEAQYIGQHPTSDAVVVVGTQDNGAIRLLGAGTWTMSSQGDGGGVGVDPRDPRRMFVQYVEGNWEASSNAGVDTYFRGPLLNAPTGATKELQKTYEKVAEAENKASSFYSNCAVIDTGSVTQAAVGTDRVWFTTDWGEHWVTLPSLAKPYDPVTPGAPEHTTDVYSPISVLRWETPDRLYVLSDAGIHLFNRTSAVWGKSPIYDAAALRDMKEKDRPTTGVIPLDVPVTDIFVHDKAKHTLYAATSGVGGEHVWWFDGSGRWIPALLWVPDADGVLRRLDSPVHSLVVDPAHPDVVYAGTDVGVFKGTGTFPATGDPSWVWKPYSNALPEAACIDLVIHPVHRLLRAALRGRGVWEVALDGVAQNPQVYVRAHDFDTRRKPIPPAGAPDPTGNPAAPTMLRLDASPDVRVYRAPGTKAPRPASLISHDFFDTWVLQSALIARGKRVEASGFWEDGMNALLGGPVNTEKRWDEAVGPPLSNILPFDHEPPDPGDLVANLKDEPDRRPGGLASCRSGTDTVRIFVAVHGRDWRPLGAEGVAVTVLRTKFPGLADLRDVPALPTGWAGEVVKDIAASTKGAWLNGKPWAYVDPAKPFRTPRRTIDAGRGEVVTWDVKLPAPAAGEMWLLLALVHSVDDKLETTETDVATLVRTDRHVAARSVWIFD